MMSPANLVKPVSRKFLLGVMSAGVLAAMSSPLAAKEAAVPPAVLTVEDVSGRLAKMEADAGIQTAVKDELRPKYQQALNALKSAAANGARAASFREAMSTAPGATGKAREELAALAGDGKTQAPKPAGDIDEIQKLLDSRKADFSRLKDDLAACQRELAALDGRPVEISERVPAAQLALANIDSKLRASGTGDPTPGQSAERTLWLARQMELESELAMLNQEQLSVVARQNLLQAREELLARKVEVEGAALEALTGWVNERLASEAKQVLSRVDAVPDEIPATDEAARNLADEVRKLARDFEKVAMDQGAAAAAHENIKRRLEELTNVFNGIRDQLKVGDGGVAMSQILFGLRGQLLSRGALMVDLTARQRELEEASLAGFKVSVSLRDQKEVAARFSDASEAVREMVKTRSEILTKLKGQYSVLTRAQAALVADERLYVDKVEEVELFVEEQLFWRRSSPPISHQTFIDAPAGMRWLMRGEHRAEFWKVTKERFHLNPFISWGCVVLIAALLLVRPYLGAAIKRTGSKIRRVSSDRYGYTAEALLWTCLLAVPAPLVFVFLSWATGNVAAPSEWLRGITKGMEVSAWMVLGAGFMAAVCRKDGLGVAHFGWPQRPVVLLRRVILLAALGFVPLMLVMSGCIFDGSSRHLTGLGRLCFIGAHLWVAFLAWRLLRFTDGGVADFIREQPTHQIVRLRYVWAALVLGMPLFIVVISSMGYLLTGIELSVGFLSAVGVVVCGVVLYWLVMRWFMMKERKLALAEAIKKRRARQETTEADEQDTDSGDMLTLDEADEKRALSAISSQTRHLLQFLFSMAVMVGVAMLWSRVLPIFSALGVITVFGDLTILDLCRALIIVVVTGSAARNLSGLLELAVLRATSLEPGARASISTLFQYAVTAIGMSCLFSVLNVDWAKLGWIAAALSVGLGFGLQEVVSNFVCGLILLFEQPIRVGDVVTVDGVEGKVSKIRMRATTIISWDRQELVVPNKNIITGTLLNWTLSNPISRVIVTVGVAYGSDTGRAMRIMEEAAMDSDYVIDDPAPLATFEAFADSCLTLKLRAYLPNIDNRIQAVSELHSEIDRRFKEAGIEIAYPQRDLHLRSAGDWVSRVGQPADLKPSGAGESVRD